MRRKGSACRPKAAGTSAKSRTPYIVLNTPNHPRIRRYSRLRNKATTQEGIPRKRKIVPSAIAAACSPEVITILISGDGTGQDIRDCCHCGEPLRDQNGSAINGIILQSSQGVVGLFERELRHFGLQLDVVSQLEEIASVGSGHIRNAAQLALSPEQPVIIKLRHAIEVNCVDGDHAPLAEAGERGNDNISTGRKGDSAVESHRRLIGFRAN